MSCGTHGFCLGCVMVMIHHSLLIVIINRPSYLKSTVQKDCGSPLVSCHYTLQYRSRPAAHSGTQFLHTAGWVLLDCCRGARNVGTQTWAAASGTGPADVPQQRDAAAVGISGKTEKILFQPMFFFQIFWVTWAQKRLLMIDRHKVLLTWLVLNSAGEGDFSHTAHTELSKLHVAKQ